MLLGQQDGWTLVLHKQSVNLQIQQQIKNLQVLLLRETLALVSFVSGLKARHICI